MIDDPASSTELPALLGGVPVRPEGPPDWPLDDPDVAEALQQIIADRSWGKYHGPYCEKLSNALADYHQSEQVTLCSSGTAAVELALRGLKVGAGDEVILAAYDFKGNYQNVVTVGAVPVLIDLQPGNWNLDPQQLEFAISENTRAIIVSHLHGGFVPMSEVMDIARTHDVPVIEDACQMPGAMIEGKKAGMWGDVGILSFGGSKLLSAGRGGALLTNTPEIVQRARLYSHRGNEAYPLSEMQAAVLVPQLRQLDARNEVRTGNVEHLCRLLERTAGLKVFETKQRSVESDQRSVPGYYKLGFQYDVGVFGGLSRDLFSEAIRAEGIAIDPGFRSLHKIHSARRFRAVGDLSHADRADENVLILHHPVLLGSSADIEQIVAAIEKIRSHAEMIQNSKQ